MNLQLILFSWQELEFVNRILDDTAISIEELRELIDSESNNERV